MIVLMGNLQIVLQNQKSSIWTQKHLLDFLLSQKPYFRKIVLVKITFYLEKYDRQKVDRNEEVLTFTVIIVKINWAKTQVY